MIRPRNAEDLQTFLAMYGGTVLRDGTPFVLPSMRSPRLHRSRAAGI